MIELQNMRALSVKQPHAEAIIRGIKPIEYRTRPTKIRDAILIYASQTRYSLKEELQWMQFYDILDIDCEHLPRGVIIGTVDLHHCIGGEWHVRNPVRLNTPIAPKSRPMPTWFFPFRRKTKVPGTQK